MQASYALDRAEFNKLPYWADETAFIGTGPYRLTRWERGAQMQFEAFDRYYLGPPKLDRIVVDIVQDNNTAQARVLAGDVDGAWGVDWARESLEQVRSGGLGGFG